MNLIYYYPFEGTNAPSMVAKCIFKYLEKREKDLPFDNLVLYTNRKYADAVQKQFSNREVITCSELNKINKTDVVHIPISPHIFPNSKFLLNIYSVMNKNKLILQYHGDVRREYFDNFKFNGTAKLFNIPSFIGMPYVLNKASRIVVHSYRMSNLLVNKYNVKDCLVIRNGIEDFWLKNANKTNLELEGSPNIFYHGRLSKGKGVDLLIEGFSKGVNQNSKAKLYIAGEGPLLNNLKHLCVKLGIESNVIFLGHIKQIEHYLSNVDAAIYPSRYEAFSLAILEAFSSVNGPVFYSSNAGIDDFITEMGYHLNSFEPSSENISEIVVNLLSGKYDSKKAEHQQKDFANQFSWDKIIPKYIELYDCVCKQKNL